MDSTKMYKLLTRWGTNRDVMAALCLIAFYVIWTLRGYLLYELFGGAAVEVESLEQSLFRAISKFFWLPFALVMALIYFGKEWRSKIYFSLLRYGKPGSILIGFVPFLYAGAFELASNSLPVPVASMLWLIPSVIYEEVLFRGVILPYLVQKMAFWKANSIQSVLFLLAHYCWWYFDPSPQYSITLGASAYIFIVGWLWGYSAGKSKSISVPLISHFLHNAILS